MNHTRRWSLAAGTAVLSLAVSMPARAGDMPGSGGPGTLGTEVPFDSREAELYYDYYLPTDTPEALRIRDGMQRLRAVHEGAITLAIAGSRSADPRVREYAQTLREDHERVDWALRNYFEYSKFDATGPAYAEAWGAWRSAVDEVLAAEGTAALDAAFLSRAAALLEEAAAGAHELVPQAREERRQVLTSHLERERKLMRRQIAEARAIEAGGTADAR